MFVLHMAFVLAKTSCIPNEMDCIGNTMRICTEEGYWAETECPSSTSCTKKRKAISCEKDDSDRPVELDEKKKKTVTVTKKMNQSMPKTVTKRPKEISLEVGEDGGKEMVYSIALESPSGGGPGTGVMSTVPSSGSTGATPAVGSSSTGASQQQPAQGATPAVGSSSTGASQQTPSAPSPSGTGASQQQPAQGATPAVGSSSSSTPAVGSSSSSTKSSQAANNTPNKASGAAAQSSGSSNQPSTSQQPTKATNPPTGQTGSPTQSTSASSGGNIITVEKLAAAVKENGMNPVQKYIEAVVKDTNANFKNKEEAAMYLAQLAHESVGFAHIEEVACKNGCPGQYGTGAPGKSYHGRGFMQLSWPDNYKKAGQALGMGDKLYSDPDIVVKDLDVAVKVSRWYWESVVMKAPGMKDLKQFGLSTKAINGVLECQNNSNLAESKKRYKLYKSIAGKMGITKLADESGCYSL